MTRRYPLRNQTVLLAGVNDDPYQCANWFGTWRIRAPLLFLPMRLVPRRRPLPHAGGQSIEIIEACPDIPAVLPFNLVVDAPGGGRSGGAGYLISMSDRNVVLRSTGLYCQL